ncbi:uncharacterized protein LOC109891846 [Oncorhynchus kisutch]|uniref:uncharacterized protein LOC109891846 n=1 Tax=Oncorhynchus kisutch TaxID=8019 RepID=UPI0012DDBDDA|nr:uncharacterized protein LOC109891846 [Oncorhynchus kisutch]
MHTQDWADLVSHSLLFVLPSRHPHNSSTGLVLECPVQTARMLLRISMISALLAYFLLFGFALEREKQRDGGLKKAEDVIEVKKDLKVVKDNKGKKKKVEGVVEVKRDPTVGNNKKGKKLTQNKKVKGKETGSPKRDKELRNDTVCSSIGGICQRSSYVCQGRYLKDKCAAPKTHQCCMPAGAWSVLCAGHHNNRVRGCDLFGCGGFNSRRDDDSLHKAVDVVCDDYSIVNAPFSGTLRGPVVGIQYDGVKLTNSEYCVKIFNIRPYRYMGPISQGEALGYLLPLQERFSGITSHMELQMCDRSDPSPYI